MIGGAPAETDVQEKSPNATSQTIIIQPTSGLSMLHLRSLWEYRQLIYFLVWRDIKVRYKQTALGIAWIVLQPIVAMIVFSVLFGGLLNAPSGGVPYPIFTFTALLPWGYFAGSLTRSSTNLVDSAHLITKVYFPRMSIPIAGVLSGLVDFAVAFVVLIFMMVFYRIVPTPAVVLLPAFLLLAMITALGFGLWLSALNVRFRDVKHMVPFLVQMWMFLTPVVYSSTILPEPYRYLMALNPMTGVVVGFRWALLGNYLADAQPPDALFPISIAISLVVLVSGAFYFRSTERTFADII